MQVPDNFYFNNKSAALNAPDSKSKPVGQPGDDAFNKVLARQNKQQPKQTKSELFGKQTKGFTVNTDEPSVDTAELAAADEADENGEQFSLFNASNKGKAPPAPFTGKTGKLTQPSHTPPDEKMAATAGEAEEAANLQDTPTPAPAKTAQPLSKEQIATQSTLQQPVVQEKSVRSPFSERSSTAQAPKAAPKAAPTAMAGSVAKAAPQEESSEADEALAYTSEEGEQGDVQNPAAFKDVPQPATRPPASAAAQVVKQHQAPDKAHVEQQAGQAHIASGGPVIERKKAPVAKSIFEYAAPQQAGKNPVATRPQAEANSLNGQSALVFKKPVDEKERDKHLFEYAAPSHEAEETGNSAAPRTLAAETDAAEERKAFMGEKVAGNVPAVTDATQPQRQHAVAGSKEHAAAWQQTREEQQASLRVAMQGEKVPQPSMPEEEAKLKAAQKAKNTDRASVLPQQDVPQLRNNRPAADGKLKAEDEEVAIDPTAVAALASDRVPRGDAASIQPQVTMTTPPTPPLAPKLQEIIDQVVKAMYTVTSEGQTDTTIELQYPPLFQGVTVTISSYQQAPGQLNIAFSNLTSSGKRMLDENLASLRLNLEKNASDVVVHQLTTTTLHEVPRYAATENQQQQQSREQRQGEQQQRRNKDDLLAEEDSRRPPRRATS